ncbi:TMM81 protein, partial [Nothocercus nigrocapillus]|nr:TMM81 protein [Nothocercus nigrocapillus]
MKTLENSLILGILACVFYLPLIAPYKNITIPAELKSVVAKVSVNTTSCSVTCGLGFKVEEMCEITPAGERRNCSLRTSDCVARWVCGLLHFSVPAGRAFELSCLSAELTGVDSRAYIYTWRLAQGLITTNDVLFKPFRNADSVIRLSPARESDAGTYRCDVQVAKTFKVIKRVYFGIRVIQSDLVDLNFQKSLTLEQKIAESEEEGNKQNVTHIEVQQQQSFWQNKLLNEPLIGLAVGVLGGVLGSTVLSFLWKIRRS